MLEDVSVQCTPLAFLSAPFRNVFDFLFFEEIFMSEFSWLLVVGNMSFALVVGTNYDLALS